jgi:hypothetical protein
METDFTPHLEEAIRRLRETINLLAPIVENPTPDGTPSCSDIFGFHPPVIDNRNTPWTSGDPLGMRKFIDSMSTQMTLLEAVRLYLGQSMLISVPRISNITKGRSLTERPGVHHFRQAALTSSSTYCSCQDHDA